MNKKRIIDSNSDFKILIIINNNNLIYKKMALNQCCLLVNIRDLIINVFFVIK